MLNENTKNYLLNMGWYPNRYLDSRDEQIILIENGFIINDRAISFISEFNELSGCFPRNTTKTIEAISFDIKWVVENFFPDLANGIYSQTINEGLCLVGSAYNGHLALYISSSGKLYGGFDDFFELLGENYYEGLNTLFADKRGQLIQLIG